MNCKLSGACHNCRPLHEVAEPTSLTCQGRGHSFLHCDLLTCQPNPVCVCVFVCFHDVSFIENVMTVYMYFDAHRSLCLWIWGYRLNSGLGSKVKIRVGFRIRAGVRLSLDFKIRVGVRYRDENHPKSVFL